MRHTRKRYQQGSLTTRKGKDGPVWIYRWREADSNGRKVQRNRVIGTKQQYPTKSAAWRAVEGLKLDINADMVSDLPLTIHQLAEHYKHVELGMESRKTPKTVSVYTQHIDQRILPRWGSERIGDVKAFRVEDWLGSLDLADGTKAKTKAVFSAMYQHALRYGWAARNPIKEVRQSAKPQHEPEILTTAEAAAIMVYLPAYARSMVIVAAVTGLRKSELVGLKWVDIDFEHSTLNVRRSVVDGRIGPPKTQASKRALPVSPALAYALDQWRQQTSYSKPEDWVFASPAQLGQMPYWASTVLEKLIRPAALAAGITKHIGWHTYRRSVATWLVSNGETVKTAQELLRHASPSMTLGTYAQAIDESKHIAQERITEALGLVIPA